MAYYILFFFSGILALFQKNRKVISLLLIVVLTLFAGSRYFIDNDYAMYSDVFTYIEDSTTAFSQRLTSLEWSMFFIPHFFKLFFVFTKDVGLASFMLFAFLGVGFKISAIGKYADFFFLSVLLYVSNLFFIMEMTTIRAGVASGIFLFSLQYLEKKENVKYIAVILSCLFFHTTAILFILIWVLLKFKFQIKYYYYGLLVSIILMLLKLNLLTLLFLDKIFPRVKTYIEIMDWKKEANVNVLNFKALFAVTITIIFAIFYKKLKNRPYFVILFKTHVLSLCIFFALSPTSLVFPLRTFDMFSVVQILLYPMLIYIFNPKLKILGYAIILLFAIIQIYYLVDVSEIYKPYQSWL